MRISIFLLIIALANFYITARLWSFAPFTKTSILIPLLIAIVLFGIELLDLRGTFFQTYPLLKLCSSIITGAFFCLFFYVVVADFILLVAQWWAPPQFTAWLFYGVVATTIVTVTIGAFQAIAGPQIKNVTVAIKNLPPAFENYKIVQVSDLHIGGTIRKDYVQHVVTLVNQTDADLIALTGDFADGSVLELKDDSVLLKNLKSKDGIYFITGNHEYYHDAKDWLPFYRSLGFHVLLNSHDVITKGSDQLTIAGVTDYSTRSLNTTDRIDIGKAATGMPAHSAKILLMHQPVLYKEAAAAGFDLQLSGHTHGGQFFPWTLVIPFFHHFYKGLGRYENLQVYVNVGTGYWGPTLRTFNPSEITVLTLKRSP